MIGYSGRKLVPAGFSVNGTQTATASDHVVTQSAAATFPKFPRETQVHKVVVQIKTAPNAGSTNTLLVFNNGSNAIGTATIASGTAGQTVEVDSTTNNKFLETTNPTIDIVGTATASENVDSGTYDVYLEV